MYIIQRPDGTFIRALSRWETLLCAALNTEVTQRTNDSLLFNQQIGDINNHQTTIQQTLDNLIIALQEETFDREVADNNLQMQIDLIDPDHIDTYTKDEMRLILVPWRVEEIDIPYDSPDNSFFDVLTPMNAIRAGYVHFEDCVINVPRGSQVANTMIRYSVWVYLDAAANIEHTFNINYDNQVAIYINGQKTTLEENLYISDTLVLTLTFDTGWNKIQILQARNSEDCGLLVETTLTNDTSIFASLAYPSGTINSDLIGPGAIKPGNLDITDEYLVRKLTAYESGIVEGKVQPALTSGNGYRGAIKIGNVLLEKRTDEGTEIILHGNLRVAGAFMSDDTGLIDNRMFVFIDPVEYQQIDCIGEVIDDIRGRNGRVILLNPNEGLTDLKIIDGFSEVLYFGNYALTIRMMVTDVALSNSAITVIVNNGITDLEFDIISSSLMNANSFELTGINFKYIGPGSLTITLKYPNHVGIRIDYLLLTLTSPVNIELPEHSHNNLYLSIQDTEDMLGEKANAVHNHAPSDISTDINNRFVTEAEMLTWYGKANAVHNHTPGDISTDLNNRFVTDTEKVTWNGKAAGTHAATHRDDGADSLAVPVSPVANVGYFMPVFIQETQPAIKLGYWWIDTDGNVLKFCNGTDYQPVSLT